MATYSNFPFDPELFTYNYENAKDMTLTTMIESGAVVNDPQVANLIANGGDYYTLPFYKKMTGTAENYDGATDITVTGMQGSAQNGIVFGRAHAWKAMDFQYDYNNADPMKSAVDQLTKYWSKGRQTTMLKILDGVFGVSASGWNDHKTDIASANTTVTSANKMSETTLGDALQKAVGDASDEFALCFMHSKVANGMAGLKLLNFLKYTDANGIERPLNIGYINGMLVIVNDTGLYTSATESVAGKYTTYVLGTGAIRYAKAPVKNGIEFGRDRLDDGGYDYMVSRIRETLHPYGFSFTKPAGYTASPTDSQLATSANWSMAVEDHKSIALCRIVTNG